MRRNKIINKVLISILLNAGMLFSYAQSSVEHLTDTVKTRDGYRCYDSFQIFDNDSVMIYRYSLVTEFSDSSGLLIDKYSLNNDEQITGLRIENYSNGNLQCISNYIDGVLVGPYLQLSKRGIVMEFGEYSLKNLIDGVEYASSYKENVETGELETIHTLIYKKIGKWKYWDIYGRLEKEEFYSEEGELIETRTYLH